MAERTTWDLIRLLPIRGDQQRARDWLPPLPEWGDATGLDFVAAFLRLNPTLHYHSAGMERLLAARRDLLFELRMQEEKAEARALGVQEEKLIVSRTTLTTPSDKGARRQDKASKSRKTTQTSVHSISLSSNKIRIKTGTRRRKSLQVSTTMSSSMMEEDLKQLRSEMNVAQLYQDAYALDEEAEKKEDVLLNVNQAILIMSPKPFTPPMRHYKHVILREALVRMCDDIATLEWKLRRSLHLLDDSRFHNLTTFPQDLVKTTDPKKAKDPKKFSKSSAKEKQLQTEEPPEPVDWSQPVPAQYKKKLTASVYVLLASTLESLLPVLMFDEYCLNPLMPSTKL